MSPSVNRPSPFLVLASSSPRRREIMRLLEVPYQIVVLPVPEDAMAGEQPEHTCRRIALAKAQATASHVGKGIVVGADTLVVLDGAVLGKPATREEATAMLRALRGRSHEVITAVAVLDLDGGRERVTATCTEVQMRDYSEGEISGYVGSGEPMDKAGAYAVQSITFRPAERVRGCYLNVVGLPICTLAAILHDLGVPTRVSPNLQPASCPYCHVADA